MSPDPSRYETPLSTRYASEAMSHLFSPAFKHLTWRKLWIALARAERLSGLNIRDDQIAAMEKACAHIDWEKAASWERSTRHDVMAHIKTFAEQAPEAADIIHLGATSCYVTDNTDLLQMREGLSLLRHQLVQVIRHLSAFAERYAKLATASYTHFQPAQPTTVGKRACLWLQDFVIDLHDLEHRLGHFPFLGVKGATGTQASFLALFQGDEKKVRHLETLVAKEMGFTHVLPIAGQTYTRKLDMQIFSILGGIAATSHKFATDMRLLAHLKEVMEPFGKEQVGSSAMPYKRNPMLCERVCSLSRFVISLQENPAYTAATQWLERSLDDSAGRRLAIPEAFLAIDGVLQLVITIAGGMEVNENAIREHLEEELPSFSMEPLLMAAVHKGKDRQKIHHYLREVSLALSQEPAALKKEFFLTRLIQDSKLGLTRQEIEAIQSESLMAGCAPSQVAQFLENDVKPLLKRYTSLPAYAPSVEV